MLPLVQNESQELHLGKGLFRLFLMNPKVSSVTQLCPTLFDTMDGSTPVFPVHHQLLELAQAHVHQVSDAIQTLESLRAPRSKRGPVILLG